MVLGINAAEKKLGYKVSCKAGDTHQLSAEQFYSGTAVLSGKWTP